MKSITRTITQFDIEFTVADASNKSIEMLSLTTHKRFKTTKGLEKHIKSNLADGLVLLSIDRITNRDVTYSMSLEDFINHAHVVAEREDE